MPRPKLRPRVICIDEELGLLFELEDVLLVPEVVDEAELELDGFEAEIDAVDWDVESVDEADRAGAF